MTNTTTGTAQETNRAPAATGRPRRRWTVLAVSAAAAAAVVGLAACGASKTELRADLAGPGPAVAAGDRTATFNFTGKPDTFSVPAGVTSLSVDVAGGAGGGDFDSTPHKVAQGQAGAGYEVAGLLAVTPGEELVIAVGGGGGLHDGNKNPGAGGWGLTPLLAGGTGGGGHSGGNDGSGGGGGSTIARDGRELVVAGGGGGMGGATAVNDFIGGGQKGGDAGRAWGENGYAAIGQTGGRGATADNQLFNSHGGSATSGAAGGGGGGGGGYVNGEGGTKGALGGGGGGGGNSYTVLLTGKSESLNTTRMANGFVKLSWVPDYSGVYVFHKTGTADVQLLEDNDSSSEQGAVIDTWEPVHDGDTFAANYRWDYQYLTGKNAGLLRNQASGLCLEVNGSDGKIDQWPCDTNADNHLWRIVPTSDGGVALMVVLDQDTAQWKPGTYYLATTVDPGSVTNGSQLTLNPNLTDSRSEWQSQRLG